MPRPEAERVWELAARLAQVQTQLAVHWGEVARAAAQRFVTRAGALGGAPSLEQTLKLYELWVACAEEAYGATARTEAFSRLQSELANVSAALLVEQRRHAESLVRAFGLPTRNEVDALYAHVTDLSRRLNELEARAARTPGEAEACRGAPEARAKAPPEARQRATGPPRVSAAAAADGIFPELALRVSETLARLVQARGVDGRLLAEARRVQLRQDDAL